MQRFKVGDKVFHPKMPNSIFTVLEVREYENLPWYTLTDGEREWDTHGINYKKTDINRSENIFCIGDKVSSIYEPNKITKVISINDKMYCPPVYTVEYNDGNKYANYGTNFIKAKNIKEERIEMETKFQIGDMIKTNENTKGKITDINFLGAMPKYKVWDGEKAIWYYEMQLEKVTEPMDAVRYGEILTDDSLYCEVQAQDGFKDYKWVRIRTICYESKIYYLKMENGEIVDFKALN